MPNMFFFSEAADSPNVRTRRSFSQQMVIVQNLIGILAEEKEQMGPQRFELFQRLAGLRHDWSELAKLGRDLGVTSCDF